MTESEQVWVYAADGQRRGPSSAREIAALISGDRLPVQTLVWKPGMSDWAPAGDIAEISRYCAPPLPRSLGGHRRDPLPPIAQGQTEDVDQGDWQGVAGVLAGDPASTEKRRDGTAPSGRPSVAPRVLVPPTPTHRPISAGKWVEGLKGLAFIIVVSVGGVIGREIGRGVVPRAGSADRPTAVAFLARVAEQMNRQLGLPKLLDAETQLIRVEALEGILVYQNRFINYSKDQMDPPALESAQRQALQRNVCTTPATRDNLLKRGIMMRYVYRDRFDAFIMSIDIRPRDCGL